jgi:hypothetical protein
MVREQADDDAIPRLEALLEHSEAWLRAGAAIALSHIGTTNPKVAVPILIKAQREKDLWAGPPILKALNNLVSATVTESIPVLFSEMNNTDYCIRYTATHTVTRIVQQVKLTVPSLFESVISALIIASKDTNYPNIQHLSICCLSRIGKPVELIAPILVEALGKESKILRKVCASALHKMGDASVPWLAKGMESTNGFVRARATKILAKSHPDVFTQDNVSADPNIAILSAEDRQIVDWFSTIELGEYLNHLQLFWCIGLVDREALHSAKNALGYENLIMKLREQNPRFNEVELRFSNGYIRHGCLADLEGLFDREPFYSEAWDADEIEPELRLGFGGKKGQTSYSRWTPKARKAWHYVDRFLTIRRLLPTIEKTE